MTDPTATSWRDLYLAALFSLDDAEIAGKIEAAEKAICARAHELFELRADSIEEGTALHDAGYALRALRGCVALRTNRTPASSAAATPNSPVEPTMLADRAGQD